jgi:hypothetical protein
MEGLMRPVHVLLIDRETPGMALVILESTRVSSKTFV